MQLNLKRLSLYFVFLVLGMSMISFGLMNIAYDLQNEEMTDQEIIQRAEDLGMVELKEQLNKTNE
jgi:hypothetical protein